MKIRERKIPCGLERVMVEEEEGRWNEAIGLVCVGKCENVDYAENNDGKKKKMATQHSCRIYLPHHKLIYLWQQQMIN